MNKYFLVHLFAVIPALFAVISPATAAAPPTTSSAAGSGSNADADFQRALRLLKAGNVAEACDLFDRSYQEGALPGALFNLAKCRETEGRYAESYRWYLLLATRATSHEQAATAATLQANADALIPKLARLDLVRRADAVTDVTGIELDDVALLPDQWTKPQYVAPDAPHTIRVQHADGTILTRAAAPTPAGRTLRIELDDPAPLPPEPVGPLATAPLDRSPPARVAYRSTTPAFVVGGASVALLGAGAVFGILAIHQGHAAESDCDVDGGSIGDCAPSAASSARHDLTVGRTFATLSDVGLIAGGAGALVATYLFVRARTTDFAPASAARDEVRWRIVPVVGTDVRSGHLDIAGTF